ncbi:NUDIX domain-containing protein [Streptomyces sp. AM 3-1-1]|uniref:NUDIX hydrolase n=1 Tax=Streptomyces sp. AM 3-1-1 TaxID=3028711 RepID=UPI0023B9DF43|nr:NUDIX domain-containing protein [Streptomyces sp. AM 3-1-1]WEH30822.1 NUDIX domain-containing protein [Streptomyces sp. AM 3-1-1]
MSGTPAVRRRRTSRVLLTDPGGRLLLLCARDPRTPGAAWWFTVGGGIEAGESPEEAALREVAEETGLVLRSGRLGPVVWTRRALFTVDGVRIDQDEEFRVVVLDAAEAAAVRVDTREATHGHRWWGAEALATTAETVRPRGIADRLPALLAAEARGDWPVAEHLGDVDEDVDAQRA